MRSHKLCTQCLRAFHQIVRAEQSPRLSTKLLSSTRALSTQPSRWQQQQQQQQHPASGTEVPPVLPTTIPTATSNVTASQPAATPAKHTSNSDHSTPSTAEMQRRISDSLSSSPRPSLPDQLARTLRRTAKSATETYITYGTTESLFKSCAAQAPYTIPPDQRNKILTNHGPPKTADGEDLGIPESSSADSFWHTELNLPATFSTWSQITLLHMYILIVRLRAVSGMSQFTNYQRYLLEHFSHAAEDKMLLLHGINARGIRNKYLKDLFIQYRGLLAAYDEGLVQGDAVLGAAVWRNVFKAREDVDWEKVAMVVAYMRKSISSVSRLEVRQIVGGLDGPEGLWNVSKRDVKSLIQKTSLGAAPPLTE